MGLSNAPGFALAAYETQPLKVVTGPSTPA